MVEALAAPSTVEGVALDLSGLTILPGLINAHEHLHFALFPRLGHGPYPNATAWAKDVYRPDEEPLRSLLGVPKHLRLLWGGLRNLLCGATTVHHHDTRHPIFDGNFPVRVVETGWAHSLEFTPDVARAFAATPDQAAFVIHLGEGTDASAGQEVFRLHEMGALGPRTVLVHAVGLSKQGWDLVARTGASVIWCPRSNMFTCGCTLNPRTIPAGVTVALGSDSPITAPSDFLDEIAFIDDPAFVAQCAGENAARILRTGCPQGDWIATQRFGEPPKLVVRDHRIVLANTPLAAQLPCELLREFFPLSVEGRPSVLVRWNTRELFEQTAEALGSADLRLGGRRVTIPR